MDGSALAEEVIPYMVPVARELDLPVEIVRVMPTWDEYLRRTAAPEFYNPTLSRAWPSLWRPRSRRKPTDTWNN